MAWEYFKTRSIKHVNFAQMKKIQYSCSFLSFSLKYNTLQFFFISFQCLNIRSQAFGNGLSVYEDKIEGRNEPILDLISIVYIGRFPQNTYYTYVIIIHCMSLMTTIVTELLSILIYYWNIFRNTFL